MNRRQDHRQQQPGQVGGLAACQFGAAQLVGKRLDQMFFVAALGLPRQFGKVVGFPNDELAMPSVDGWMNSRTRATPKPCRPSLKPVAGSKVKVGKRRVPSQQAGAKEGRLVVVP